MDIGFIILDKLSQPGLLPDFSRFTNSYFGEADENCFVIRGVQVNNRPPRPVAEAVMERLSDNVTKVTVEFKFHWRMKVILGFIGFVVAQMIYRMVMRTDIDTRYIGSQMLILLMALVTVLYFLYRFRSDCQTMKSLMLELFNGKPLKG